MGFSGKVAIVTGASSGIGAAIAIALARNGAKVVLVARNEAKLNDVAKQCEQHGSQCLVIRADLSKDEDIRIIVKNTIDHFGQIDVLVNNAGIARKASILDENVLEYYDLVMNTNLRSIVLLTHLTAPHLVNSKGNIINISSIWAIRILQGEYLPYAVSKAGLDHFTRCVALDLASSGVRANCVNPGVIKTDILDSSGLENPDAVWAAWKTSVPLKKLGEPEEIADLVLFLASDKARSITGSSFVCDNGGVLKNH